MPTMPRANVEIVRELFAVWREKGPEAAIKYMDPDVDVDFTGVSGASLGRVVATRGVEGLQNVFLEWFKAFGSFDWSPQNFIDAGDHVVVLLNVSGVGRGSGVPVERSFTVIYTLKNGAIVRFRGYDTLEAAAGAIGI
jgi:ketosteroid isomerase-like protein